MDNTHTFYRGLQCGEKTGLLFSHTGSKGVMLGLQMQKINNLYKLGEDKIFDLQGDPRKVTYSS